uniref:Cyclin dependent kinase 2 associated protein 1 n=1 Tax=Cebus imitator TaxID=2715852 RepID=A0A2K5Q923_CEBIM
MSYKPNLAAHMPAAALNAAGSVHSPSTSMATSSQYRQLLSDYGPPSLGYTQIIHARGLVRECLAETERNARS